MQKLHSGRLCFDAVPLRRHVTHVQIYLISIWKHEIVVVHINIVCLTVQSIFLSISLLLDSQVSGDEIADFQKNCLHSQ